MAPSVAQRRAWYALSTSNNATGRRGGANDGMDAEARYAGVDVVVEPAGRRDVSAVAGDDDESAGGGSEDEAAGAEALREVTGAARSSTTASSSSSTTAASRARPRPRQRVGRVHGHGELVVGTMGSGSSGALKVFDEMSSPT